MTASTKPRLIIFSSIGNIPQKTDRDLKEGDLNCAAWHISDWPFEWWAIVYRPKTNEVFRLHCSDGEDGGYTPDLPSGKLPDHVIIPKQKPRKY
jgi:hypothetical protein